MRTEGRQWLHFRMDGPVHAFLSRIETHILLSESIDRADALAPDTLESIEQPEP